jgi:hypothetical protein
MIAIVIVSNYTHQFAQAIGTGAREGEVLLNKQRNIRSSEGSPG